MRAHHIGVAETLRFITQFALKAGQASLHHGLTVHGSNPNTSGRRRCGMTVRFTTPNEKPVPGVFVDKPILISGKDRFGHFEYLPRPEFAASANSTPEMSHR